MKNKLLVLLFAAVAVTIILLFLFKCNPTTPVVTGKIDSVFYWKNKYHEQVASVIGTAADFAVINKQYQDSLASVYNTKKKWLQDYLIAWTSGETEVPAVDTTKHIEYYPVNVESDCPPQIKSMSQSFHSAYYNALAQIGDSSYLYIQHTDTLTAIWKTVVQGNIFKRKKFLQLDLNFADTSNKVVGVHAYRKVMLTPKRFGIGVQAGYQFNGSQFQPYFGIGISYNVIRF